MLNKYFYFLLFLGLIITLNGFTQTGKGENVSSIAKFQSFNNQTYIAYKGGIGNIERLKYEICFAPSFMIQLKKFPELGLEFAPQFLIRSYNQYSHPVRTPSYMPKSTIYYHIRKAINEKPDIYSFLTYGHHSNGQDGLFYKSDNTTINIIDGSFSSNYLLGGVIFSNPEKTIFNPFRHLKFSATYNFIHDMDVRNLYGKLRFFADLESTINLSKERGNIFNDTRSKSKLIGSLNLGWIASDLIHSESVDLKRLIFSYSLTYQPSFVTDLALFTRFYYGQDYYNINFERTLKLFQFGIQIKNLHF